MILRIGPTTPYVFSLWSNPACQTLLNAFEISSAIALISPPAQQIVNMLTENSQYVSTGPESTKNVLKVTEKASDDKMFSQTIINKRFLLIIGRRLIGRYLPGSHLSQSFIKIGITDAKLSIYCIA